MVHTTQLRIGNWVMHDNEPYQFKLDSFERLTDGSDPKMVQWFQDLEPIPLTPEILEKCGFKLWDDMSRYSIEFENGNTFQVTNCREVFLGGGDACTEGHGFDLKIYHLHQLQNLYFSLTGKELEVKL